MRRTTRSSGPDRADTRRRARPGSIAPRRGRRATWLVHVLSCMLSCALSLIASSCGLFSGSYVAVDEQQRPVGVPIEVVFEGAGDVSESRVRRKIEDRMLDLSRTPESIAILEDAKFDVEDYFRQEGFADVEVQAEFGPAADAGESNLHILTFHVTANARVTVRKLELVGATDFSRETLTAFWLQRGSGSLGLGAPLYIETDIQGFVQTLRLYLIGEGYLDARVELAPVTRSDDGVQVDLLVHIDEGTPYTIGSIEFDPALRTAIGDAELELPTGQRAAARRVDELRNTIQQRLRRDGHPEPHVRMQLGRDSEAHRVTIQINGAAGRRATIADVRIRGLVDTSESVVRGLLDFEIGDAYDGTRIDESLRDLYLTGLFRKVEVVPVWLDTGAPEADPGQLAIELQIEEVESRSIEALVGWGSYERARTKLRFEESNLFGTGRGLVLEGRLSQKGWRTLASISDRNFLNTRTLFSITGDALEREEPSFIDRAYGGTVTFSRELVEQWTNRVGYSYRPHSGLQSDAIDPASSITSYIEASPFFETRVDSRDSPIYPRTGLQVSAKVDANDPAFGSDIAFGRLRFSASYYVPLSQKLGLALRTDQGWLWPGEGSDRVPFQERFYNGGENSVRSFRQSELGPKDVNGTPLGGEFSNTFNVEARLRLIQTLEGALFVDAGNVGSDVRNYGLSDMRYGLGLGLRLALPIGPIRVDGAWNPDRRADEDNWVVHVSVGYPF